MGELDRVLKRLLEDKPRFADLFNANVFGGRQVLKPESLKWIPAEAGILTVGEHGLKRSLQRYRDVVMGASLGGRYVVFGAESQGEVDYGMPVRDMLYAALDYTRQIEELQRKHRESGDRLAGGELLSGIRREDRLNPVVTLTLYWGNREWDGSRSLHDLIGLDPKEKDMRELLRYLPDHKINLLNMKNPDHVERYRSSLQYIFGMLKCNTDKELLYSYVHAHRDEINHMDGDSRTALVTLLGEQKRLSEILNRSNRGEEIDLCKAIDDLIMDGMAKGEKVGEIRGEIRGEDRLSGLISLLLKNGRQNLIERVVEDREFRKGLYKEYNL